MSNLASSNLILTWQVIISAMANGSNAGKIAVYWDQNGNNGTLAEACVTVNYDYVIFCHLCEMARIQ